CDRPPAGHIFWERKEGEKDESATQEEVAVLIRRLADHYIWPDEHIIDPDRYLAIMQEAVSKRNFSVSILEKVVREAAVKYESIPSIKEIISDCENLRS